MSRWLLIRPQARRLAQATLRAEPWQPARQQLDHLPKPEATASTASKTLPTTGGQMELPSSRMLAAGREPGTSSAALSGQPMHLKSRRVLTSLWLKTS